MTCSNNRVYLNDRNTEQRKERAFVASSEEKTVVALEDEPLFMRMCEQLAAVAKRAEGEFHETRSRIPLLFSSGDRPSLTLMDHALMGLVLIFVIIVTFEAILGPF